LVVSSRTFGGMNAAVIPTKMFFRIGEVARMLDVGPHVVRFWEKEFRSVRPRKSASGQRVFNRHDVQVLTAIKHLLYEQRFTIEGARRSLRERGIEVDEQTERENVRAARLRDGLTHVRGRLTSALDSLDRVAAG